MTLAEFKSRLKVTSLVFGILVYGIFFYILGKNSALGKIATLDIINNQKQDLVDFPIESPIPYSDTQKGSVISSFVKLCSNTTYSFEVAYPKDWFTTYNDDSQKCLFFAPYSFIVPKDTSIQFVPIKLELTSIDDWEVNRKFYENPNDFQNIVSVENKEIDAKPIEKIKAETTQEGTLEKGLTKITYLIFENNNPVIISYQQLDKSEDVKQYEDVINEMAASLRFF